MQWYDIISANYLWERHLQYHREKQKVSAGLEAHLLVSRNKKNDIDKNVSNGSISVVQFRELSVSLYFPLIFEMFIITVYYIIKQNFRRNESSLSILLWKGPEEQLWW